MITRSRWRLNRRDTLRRVALLAAILLSGGLLMIPRIPLALIVILIAVQSFGFLSRRIVTRNALVYAWIIFVMALAFIHEQHVDAIANVTRLTNFIVGLSILKIYWGASASRFMDDYIAILVPIAIIGIGTVVLAVAVPAAFSAVHIGPQGMFTIAGMFNYSVPLVESAGPPRPLGFFWEPGVFAAHLNILLFILFLRQERLILVAAVFYAILVTQSTTGIGVAVLVSMYFIIHTVLNGRLKLREVLILVATFVAAPAIFALTNQNVSDKLFGAAAGSFSARLFDFSMAAKVIGEHPLTGIGFSELAYMHFFGSSGLDTSFLSETDQEGRFNTNGVMIVLYSVGLPLGLLFLVGFFRQSIVPHRLCFGGALLLLLSSSPLAFTPLFCFFAFSGLSSRATDSASRARAVQR